MSEGGFARVRKGKPDITARIIFCKNCSFINYFLCDQSVKKKVADKRGASRTLSTEYGVDFLMDATVTWSEWEVVGENLPGNRKYDHLLYKTVSGTVQDFLVVFQRQCVKMKPHKIHQHEQDKRKKISRMEDNDALRADVVALFGDYSQNPKKRSSRSAAT